MVQLTRIYTKGGDKGKTSLGTGKRVLKSHKRILAIGDVDEANACLGICRLYAEREMNILLGAIQHDLFDVGADLCLPEEGQEKLRILQDHVQTLEMKIDFYNNTLSPLTSFVLPGGTSLAAFLHQARAVVRRAERTVCSLNEEEPVNGAVIQYLNRLSDLLFVLARYDNHLRGEDVLWIPGKSLSSKV